jgi:LPS-assembly lipoprotein
MSSSDRPRASTRNSRSLSPRLARTLAGLTALTIALPLLGGCGFRPVYGDRGVATAPAAALATVAIDTIPERSGQVLRNLLIDRFYADGRPDKPTWRVAVQLSMAEEELGILKDATATRARLRLLANYELIETSTGKTVYRTFSRAIVSYNILDAQYGTLISRQDAESRGLTELAEDIRTRLALYFAREPQSGPTP